MWGPTGFGVALETQHDLWSTVPSSRNVLSHVTGIFFWINRETTSQTEIANLEFTVGVDQQVTGFQITVQNIGGVDVLQTTKDLVDERLEMRIGQRLSRTNDSRQVTLHQLY